MCCFFTNQKINMKAEDKIVNIENLISFYKEDIYWKVNWVKTHRGHPEEYEEKIKIKTLKTVVINLKKAIKSK